MKSIRVWVCFMGCVLLAGGLALAQGAGSSGDLTGTVFDPSGAALTNATVTATDSLKGTKRSVQSDSLGRYRIPGLLPSIYNLSVTRSGFQTATQSDVTVQIGQTVALDFHLKVSGTTTAVEVIAEAPVIDTNRGHQADTISQRYIQDLPINRRDYLTFTLLAPGVANSTRLASDQDFRVKQTPQSGLSFYGSNGRGNSVTVDGGEANDDAGGVRLTLSQDAVQEYQINRSNYGAELGGASGANINIISRSGTNNLHGTLFGFFRNDIFDAANPFAFTQALAPGQPFLPTPGSPNLAGSPTKDTLSRQQFGGSLGFPIQKDKTFAFLAAEGLRSDAQNSVPILTNTNVFGPDSLQRTGNNQQGILSGLASLPGNPMVPCLSTPLTLLPAASCAAVLTSALTVTSASPIGAFLVNQAEANGGIFPYDTREYFISGRLDHIFNETNQAHLRYNFAHDDEQNPDVQSLIGFSAGSSIKTYDNTAQLAWFHQFSARSQNELRIQYNYTLFDVIPNVQGQVGLVIPGFATVGANIFLPNFTIMRRPDIADNLTLVRGHHTMSLGGEFLYRGNHTESHTFFPGRFVFGSLPGNLVSPCLSTPVICGLPASTIPASLNGLQSASLGLPQFFQQGFGNPIYNYPRPFTAVYWQDQWAMKPNFNFTYGLRYELDTQYGQLNTPKTNFAPRVSFVWDPFSDHRVAIRGGFGIFYQQIYGQIGDVVQTLGDVNGVRQIAQVFVPITGAPGVVSPVCPGGVLTSACIFQGLFATGPNGGLIGCTSALPGQAACITPADLAPFGVTVTHTGPIPPLTVLFSGQPGYQSPYSEQASFSIDGEVARNVTVSLSGIYVHTLHLPVALDTNLLPPPQTTAISPFTGQAVTFQNWGAPQCTANPTLCFVNPLLLQNNQYSSASSALYEGFIFEVRRRFSDHFSLFANYTFSKAIDTSTDFNSDYAPFDQLDLGAERALSDFNQTHKVVFSGVFTSASPHPILAGWELAPIISYNSGHPFNILAGGTDINGDRHSTNDRPLGVARNTGLGPDYFNTDLRLSRIFKVTERAQVQLLAEGFNIFNRVNFSSVNNEVPTVGGFANVVGNPSGSFINPSVSNPGGTPFAFTSTLPMRELQFGIRLNF